MGVEGWLVGRQVEEGAEGGPPLLLSSWWTMFELPTGSWEREWKDDSQWFVFFLLSVLQI